MEYWNKRLWDTRLSPGSTSFHLCANEAKPVLVRQSNCCCYLLRFMFENLFFLHIHKHKTFANSSTRILVAKANVVVVITRRLADTSYLGVLSDEKKAEFTQEWKGSSRQGATKRVSWVVVNNSNLCKFLCLLWKCTLHTYDPGMHMESALCLHP